MSPKADPLQGIVIVAMSLTVDPLRKVVVVAMSPKADPLRELGLGSCLVQPILGLPSQMSGREPIVGPRSGMPSCSWHIGWPGRCSEGPCSDMPLEEDKQHIVVGLSG